MIAVIAVWFVAGACAGVFGTYAVVKWLGGLPTYHDEPPIMCFVGQHRDAKTGKFAKRDRA